MASVELIEGTMIGKFTITGEEALELRRHALECACRVYQGLGDYRTNEYAILNMAKLFESHLSRNTNSG